MRAVLKKLPNQVHTQSMTMASLSHSGTPDQYLDLHSDLWAEFKWNPGLPRVLDAGRMLSDLQKRWLYRRYAAGRNAVVVVGFPYENRNCGVVLGTPDLWTQPLTKLQYLPMILSVTGIAQVLLDRVSTYAAHEVHPHLRLPALAGR